MCFAKVPGAGSFLKWARDEFGDEFEVGKTDQVVYCEEVYIMEPLINAIRRVYLQAIHEFNTVKMPLLEEALGRSIIEEFPDPDKRTSETTKVLGRILDNTFFRHIHAIEPTFIEDECAGRDNCFGTIPIEQKTTFGKNDSWTGNGYDKTGWHLLKKFSMSDIGRINGCFLALVNLEECTSKWSERTLKSNFSSLQLKSVDKDKILVIVGTLKVNRINVCPVLSQVSLEQTSETRD
jgi:hypothetical protein